MFIVAYYFWSILSLHRIFIGIGKNLFISDNFLLVEWVWSKKTAPFSDMCKTPSSLYLEWLNLGFGVWSLLKLYFFCLAQVGWDFSCCEVSVTILLVGWNLLFPWNISMVEYRILVFMGLSKWVNCYAGISGIGSLVYVIE